MSRELAREILDLVRDAQGAKVVYGEATDTNTVAIAGAATAVELPALSPVRDGDYVAVMVQGADRLILGAVSPPQGATIPGVTVSNATGWSTVVNRVHRYGPLLALSVTITRTGADVAGGTIVGTVATLSAAARGGASASWPLPLLSTSGISGAAAPGIVTRYFPATGVVDVRNYLSTWTSAGSAGFAAVIPLDAS